MSIFSKIKVSRPPRSTFNLSHEKKLTMELGKITPILCEEVVPTDTFNVSTEIMLKFMPMIAPIMHRVNVFTHYFFVPNRLIWEDWEEFITGGIDGTSAPVAPYVQVTNDNKVQFGKGYMSDYLGIANLSGINITNPIKLSALPFRACRLIVNEYYVDRTISSFPEGSKASGLDAGGGVYNTVNWRHWEKDYFTSAQPSPQRGDDVEMPFSPVYKTQSDILKIDGSNFPNNTSDFESLGSGLQSNTLGAARIENLEDGAGVSINDLRTATAVQRWLEKSARSGSRYVEHLASFFGAKSSDARLQRPEYLGGGKQPVSISEVLNTAGDTGVTSPLPQGNMSGYGISVGRTNSFRRKFEEHGWIIGFMSIMPKPAYWQGIPRKFTREDRFDYYFPQFANLGEQEIKSKEVYVTGLDTENEEVFGYTPRYAEYKFSPDTISGEFRDTLEFWHLGRKFAERPVLNGNFLIPYAYMDKIFAVQGDAPVVAQVYHRIHAKRPMPYFGTPKL